MKNPLMRLLALPLLPLKPFLFFWRAEARTSRVLQRVLMGFAVGGALLSLIPGAFLLGALGERVPALKGVWDSEPALYALMAATTSLFIALSVLQWAAARGVLATANAPLARLTATPGLDKIVQAFFITLALVLFLGSLNFSALGLLIVGAFAALFASILFLMFTFVLIVVTFGAVLAGSGLEVGATLEKIWTVCTFTTRFFELEAGLISRMDFDGKIVVWIAIGYVYGLPSLLSAWIWVKRAVIKVELGQIEA